MQFSALRNSSRLDRVSMCCQWEHVLLQMSDRHTRRGKDRWKERALTGAPRVPLAPFGPGSPGWPTSPRSPTSPRGPGRPLSPWEETEYCWKRETHTHCPLCLITHTLVSVWEHKRERFLLSCHAVLCSLEGRVFLQAPVTGDKQPL